MHLSHVALIILHKSHKYTKIKQVRMKKKSCKKILKNVKKNIQKNIWSFNSLNCRTSALCHVWVGGA